MKQSGKVVMLLFLTAVFVTFTRCEDDVEVMGTPPSFKVIAFDALPAAIQSKITAAEHALKLSFVHKNDKPFGTVILTRIHRRLKPDGSASYTLALSRKSKGLYYDNLVINEDAGGNLRSHVIRYQPEALWFYQHKTAGLGYEAYSGAITVFNEAGGLLSSVNLISGEMEKEATKTTLSKANAANGCEILDVEYVGGCAGEDHCWWNEIIITVDCTGTGGGYEDDGINDDFGNTAGEEGGGPGPGGGGAGGNGGPGEPIDTVPVDELEDDQITTTLPSCLDSIVSDLKTLENGKLAQIIQQFAGNNPVPQNYNWNIITGTCTTPEATACTTPIVNNSTVTTTINADGYPNATDLSMVRTMMHETFHAYLVSVYRYQNVDKSYVNLMNQYASEFNNNANDVHHHVFTLINVVNHISEALMEYGNNNGYNLTQQFCNDMAWGGLHGTTAYNALSLNERIRIENTLIAELTNTTINETNPKGTKACPE